jgi:hypothetical protein
VTAAIRRANWEGDKAVQSPEARRRLRQFRRTDEARTRPEADEHDLILPTEWRLRAKPGISISADVRDVVASVLTEDDTDSSGNRTVQLLRR